MDERHASPCVGPQQGLRQLPARFRGVGFNQRHPPQQKTPVDLRLASLTAAEQSLLKDIRHIDRVLRQQTAPFHYHQGFLFAQGLLPDLPQHLRGAIAPSNPSVEHGFSIWRLEEQEGKLKLKGCRLGQSPLSIQTQLTEKSVYQLQLYGKKKMEQSPKEMHDPWLPFGKCHKRIKTEEGGSLGILGDYSGSRGRGVQDRRKSRFLEVFGSSHISSIL
jgi:hypothetical protein